MKAHGRILETKTARTFKTVACLNVTLAHAKIGCAVPVVGSCADCRRGVSLERLPDAALDPAILSEQS